MQASRVAAPATRNKAGAGRVIVTAARSATIATKYVAISPAHAGSATHHVTKITKTGVLEASAVVARIETAWCVTTATRSVGTGPVAVARKTTSQLARETSMIGATHSHHTAAALAKRVTVVTGQAREAIPGHARRDDSARQGPIVRSASGPLAARAEVSMTHARVAAGSSDERRGGTTIGLAPMSADATNRNRQRVISTVRLSRKQPTLTSKRGRSAKVAAIAQVRRRLLGSSKRASAVARATLPRLTASSSGRSRAKCDKTTPPSSLFVSRRRPRPSDRKFQAVSRGSTVRM